MQCTAATHTNLSNSFQNHFSRYRKYSNETMLLCNEQHHHHLHVRVQRCDIYTSIRFGRCVHVFTIDWHIQSDRFETCPSKITDCVCGVQTVGENKIKHKAIENANFKLHSIGNLHKLNKNKKIEKPTNQPNL